MNHTTKYTDYPDADPNALTIEAANARIAARMPSFQQSESVPIRAAHSRILSADVVSPMATPPFRASAMDGYAFRHADGGNTRQLVDESLAGHPGPNTLAKGTCVRVLTGAKVPDDADTVVQQENAELEADQLLISSMPNPGHHVRSVGSDCIQGNTIACAGMKVNAGLLGLCSALGIRELSVYKKIRISIISSGDELCNDDEPLQDGKIYDANAPLLTSLLDDASFDLKFGGYMRDTPDSVSETLTANADSDVIITTGGVSVGTRDHLRAVMESRGGVALWKVAMKPGRPLSFALLDGKTPWFGLPGNPVSAALTAVLFVIPALRRSQGIKTILSSLANANCFIRLPIESTGIKSGEWVEVIPYEFIDGSIG